MGSASEPEAAKHFTEPPWGRVGRDFTLGLVTIFSNAILHGLNSLYIRDKETFEKFVLHRPAGTPLFTVCNHISTIDDPMLLGAMLPWSFWVSESKHHRVRWSLCARELCYKYRILSQVFQNGKTLPIERGLGIQQPIMEVAAAKAGEGDWVHVFPEAKIGYTGRLQPLKRGIGKLVCDSFKPNGRAPVVLPFYHSGMGRILPAGGIVPKWGHTVHVSVGEPVDLSDLLPRCNCAKYDQIQVWTDITRRVAEALSELERSSPPNWDQAAGRQNRTGSGPPHVDTANSPA